MLRTLKCFKFQDITYNNCRRVSAVRKTIYKNCSVINTTQNKLRNIQLSRHYCYKPNSNDIGEKDTVNFEKVCDETLESLTDFFEELVESKEKIQSGDVSFNSGVLTVNLGKYGTYVINRQSPNKQIWLSSPKSGPKRYDFEANGSYWSYKHDSQSLHQLLQSEISSILGEQIDMSNCAHYK